MLPPELSEFGEDPMSAPRRRIFTPRRVVAGTALVALAFAGYAAAAWLNSPSHGDIKNGEMLFTHIWEPNDPLSKGGDGLGPVFNAKSCVECHFQGGKGGAGGLKHNVAAIEILPTEGHPYPVGDVVHAFATTPECQESMRTAREVFPIIPKGMTITAVCTQPLKKDYDPLIKHSINTPTLFGAGAIDRIPEVAIRANHFGRSLAGMKNEFHADFTATNSGRVRVLPDGRIGKFGWKAQFATLEEFVANACAVEIGLTTPTRKQHAPKQHREVDQATSDMDETQFTQLVAFVDRLPAPKMVLPADESDRVLVTHGRELFGSVGCADCHTPDLGGASGVFSDFCLHDVTDHQGKGYIETPDVPVPPDYPAIGMEDSAAVGRGPDGPVSARRQCGHADRRHRIARRAGPPRPREIPLAAKARPPGTRAIPGEPEIGVRVTIRFHAKPTGCTPWASC